MNKHGPRYQELQEGLEVREMSTNDMWALWFNGDVLMYSNNCHTLYSFKEGMLMEAMLTWEKFNQLADKMGI